MRLSKNDIALIQKIGDLLQHMPGASHTIAQLAQHAGLSESKLKYGFRKVFHTSIHRYLLALRMNLAQEQLTGTDQKLLSIARNSGYRHLSTFIDAFKKRYGCTPGQYRRQQEEQS